MNLSASPKALAFKRSNIVITLVLGLVAVGYFFIPEIITLQKSLMSAESTALTPLTKNIRASKLESEELEAIESMGEDTRAISPLQQVFMLLERSGMREQSAQRSSNVTRDEGARARFSGTSTLKSDAAKKTTSVKVGDGTSVDPLLITWANIRSNAAKKDLKAARSAALTLTKQIGEIYPQTRLALFNYIAGVGLLSGPQASDATMSAKEAVRYVESLDLAVTQAMLRESVDRGDYLKWSNISLGRRFGSRAEVIKNQFIIPFNPRVTLVGVKASAIDPYNYRRQEKGSSVMTGFVGYVIGKNIASMELLRNGAVVRKIALHRRRSLPDGYRMFRVLGFNTRNSIVTLRVTDKSGAVYQKHYKFYPRLSSFPWVAKEQKFVIPFQHASFHYSLFNPRQVDPRIDQFFSYQGPMNENGTSLVQASMKNFESF